MPKRFLDDAALRGAAAAIAAPVESNQAPSSLQRTPGSAMEELLREAEQKLRARLVARLKELKEALATVDAEYDRARNHQRRRIAPIRAEADVAYARWMAACESLRQRETMDQSEVSSLEVKRAEIVTAMNEPIGESFTWKEVAPGRQEPTSEDREKFEGRPTANPLSLWPLKRT